jgi:K+-sensing histidine kinase KdpD
MSDSTSTVHGMTGRPRIRRLDRAPSEPGAHGAHGPAAQDDARPATGDLPTAEPNAFDLRDLIDCCCAIRAAAATAMKVELVRRVQSGIPPTVVGDGLRVGRVLVDLIARAIELTPVGGVVVVRVTTDGARRDGAQLRFEVASATRGRVDQSSEPTLAACAQTDGPSKAPADHGDSVRGYSKRLVDLMGGEIGVTDAQGRGTTFWFTVPLAWSRREASRRT